LGRVLTRRAKVVSFALLALMCGCSSAHKFVSSTSTTVTAVVIRPTRSSTTTSSTSTTTTAPGGTVTTGAATTTTATTAPVTQPTAPAVGLAALILNAVPSGYERQADDVAQTGPTNLAQAADTDQSQTARRALLVTGFVTGYQRQWTSPDGFTIDQIFLYEFQSPKGAQGYAQHWHDTLVQTNQVGSVLHSFTPAFIPGATGLQEGDSTGSTAVVMFAKGSYAVEATVNGGAPSSGAPIDQSGPATALAFAQYQGLP
jgi:hypothetical protein